MGGTTAKSCVIKSHRPLINKTPEVARERRMKRGSGIPVGIPMVDLLEIGAGGGSIAEVDQLGLLRVGPRSAGANPGPACYGLGGREATVTDADLVLGMIDPDSFLSGSMRLDRDAAWRAITDNVAHPLGLDPLEAAAAIYWVVTDNMAEATRVHSAEVNVDLRGYWLVAFGGAGPLHAYGVADRLGLPVVVFPRHAGVLSAAGLLTAPLAFEFSRSYPVELDALDLSMANELLSDLEDRARRLLVASGVASDIRLQRTVDMCYSGQRYEVATPLPEPPLTPGSVAELKAAFDATYEETYGRRLTLLQASCLTWRVLASGPAPDRWWRTLPAMSKVGAIPRLRHQQKDRVRKVFLPGHGLVEYQTHVRDGIPPGSIVTGPALVQDGSSTIVLPPKAKGTVELVGELGRPSVGPGGVTAGVRWCWAEWSYVLITRSLLSTPGNQARMLERAAGYGADALMFDLEDSVPVAQKDTACRLVREQLDSIGRTNVIYVRVNSSESGLHLRDIDAVLTPSLHGIVVPKVEFWEFDPRN